MRAATKYISSSLRLENYWASLLVYVVLLLQQALPNVYMVHKQIRFLHPAHACTYSDPVSVVMKRWMVIGLLGVLSVGLPNTNLLYNCILPVIETVTLVRGVGGGVGVRTNWYHLLVHTPPT